jgi:ankyrin repeat protein
VALLLQAGADPSLVGADGRTPVTVSIEEGQKAIAALLLDAAAKTGAIPSASASAALADLEGKQKEAADADGGAGTGAGAAAAGGAAGRGRSGLTGAAYLRGVLRLGDAAYAGDVRAVLALLRSGVDVNGADPDGFSALHRAAAAGSLHVLDLLLAQGADPNAKDAAGCTPLHYAAFCGSADVAHVLVVAGADPQRRNRDGLTPADVASAEGKTGVHKLLTGTWTRVENLDFSHGVALEGELFGKRSGDGLGASLFKWKGKYVVLSRHYRALFAWTGTATHIDGPVQRFKLENVDAVIHDAKAVRGPTNSARRFDSIPPNNSSPSLCPYPTPHARRARRSSPSGPSVATLSSTWPRLPTTRPRGAAPSAA